MHGSIPLPALFLSSLVLAGCTLDRATSSARTATEELLISTAADRAAEKLAEQIPVNTRIVLSTVSVGTVDERYAAAAIRDRLLRRGVVLVDEKETADAVLEVRAGALSTDEHSLFLGTPQVQLPAVPGVAAAGIPLPSLNLFKRAETKATAKFAATGYETKTGKLIVATDSEFGYAEKVDWVLLFFISWTNADYLEMKAPPAR